VTVDVRAASPEEWQHVRELRCAFYRRMGFEETGEVHPLREGSSLTVAVMHRRLRTTERSIP